MQIDVLQGQIQSKSEWGGGKLIMRASFFNINMKSQFFKGGAKISKKDAPDLFQLGELAPKSATDWQ